MSDEVNRLSTAALTHASGSGEGASVSWEQRLLDLFEDLEQQAEGAALAARDSEVAELARAEYSEIDLASRWHASDGCDVELACVGGLVVRGRVTRVGDAWCLVATPPGGAGPPGSAGREAEEWLVALPTVLSVRGLSIRARPHSVRPVTARLGLASALRGLAEEQRPVTLVRLDGERRQGLVGRVGRDFLELVADGAVEVVPFNAVAALRR